MQFAALKACRLRRFRKLMVIAREPLKNYLTRPGGVEFAKKMLIYCV
jgi:hypothetical protein